MERERYDWVFVYKGNLKKIVWQGNKVWSSKGPECAIIKEGRNMYKFEEDPLN